MTDYFTSWSVEKIIELSASLIGLLGVWLTTRQKIWCWPVGLLGVILSLYVFLASKLYADVILQIFYIVLTIYGWYNWLHGGENKTILKVTRVHKKYILILVIIGFCAVFITGYVFSEFTDAALPYWDATVAVWGVIATLEQAKKHIENWIMWILTDLLCTGIYFYKELFFFAGLYFCFTLLAIYGFSSWKKDLKKIIAS
jgi:nicotinamide mononucleotide transporter